LIAEVWHFTASKTLADQVKKLTQLFIIRGHYAQLLNETFSPKLELNTGISCFFISKVETEFILI